MPATTQRLRRRKSLATLADRIVRKIVSHPANRGRRLRALTKACAWQLYKRAVSTPIRVEIPGGARMVCHPDSGSASNVIYFNGFFDYDEIHFLLRFLRPGDHVWDIGANIGFYSLLMGSLVGPTGSVEAFEPFPVNYERVVENVALNGFAHVEAHQLAVGSSRQSVEFTADLDVSNRIATERDVESEQIVVDVDRLDAILHLPAGAEVTFAKLDVEGGEVDALHGAAELLRTTPPWVWLVEVLDGPLRARGTSSTELIQLLEAAGYETALYDADGNTLDFTIDAHAVVGNLFAVHGSRRGAVTERLATPSH